MSASQSGTIYVELELDVETVYDAYRDGIGHWECHGQGFDRGQMVVEVVSTEVDGIVTIEGKKYLRLTEAMERAINQEVARYEKDFEVEEGI